MQMTQKLFKKEREKKMAKTVRGKEGVWDLPPLYEINDRALLDTYLQKTFRKKVIPISRIGRDFEKWRFQPEIGQFIKHVRFSGLASPLSKSVIFL